MSFRSYYCCDQRYLGHPCNCPKPTDYWHALRTMREDDEKREPSKPGVCGYCGHPKNSGPCQRSHP